MARNPNKTRTVAALIEVAVPKGLVEQLRRVFPRKVPKITETEREIFVEVGRQEMIEFLAGLQERQDRAALANRQVPDQNGRH